MKDFCGWFITRSSFRTRHFTKRGSWFSYNGEQLGQGRDATKEAIKGDEKLYGEIESAVQKAMNGDVDSEKNLSSFKIEHITH